MAKKIALPVALMVAAVAGGGIGMHLGGLDPDEAKTAYGLVDAMSLHDLQDRLAMTEDALERSRREEKRLRSASAALAAEIERIRSERASPPVQPAEAAEREPVAESRGVDALRYERIAEILEENLELMRPREADEKLTPEEERALELARTALTGEVLRLSAEAKELSSRPFFEEAILRGLTESFIAKPLRFDDEQMEEFAWLQDEMLGRLPEDMETLTALELFDLRRRMLEVLREGVAVIANEEQAAYRDLVLDIADDYLDSGGRLRYGIEGSPANLLVNWFANALGGSPDAALRRQLEPLVEGYQNDARDVLARYAATNDDLSSLGPAARERLNAELLDLQASFHEGVAPYLDAPRREKLLYGYNPLIVRFHWEHGSSMVGRRTNF